MSAEAEKLTKKRPGNSDADGRTDPDAVEAKYVRPRSAWWHNKPLVTLLVLLLLLCLVLLGLLVYFGSVYHGCKRQLFKDDDMDFTVEEESRRPISTKNVRLPRDILPRYYDIRLQVYLHEGAKDRFWFNGSVAIDVYCAVTTKSIYVHAYSNLNVSRDQITVQSSNARRVPGQHLKIENIAYEEDLQWFVITMQENLQAGNYYHITFGQFRSPLQTELKGWYLSSYEENGKKKFLATSQLQPTDARRVFPCWDEPIFKAQFEVTLVRRGDYRALSCMGLKHTIALGGNWYADMFHPTVNTSTYVLAFVVSQFSSLSQMDYKGRNFTVWARPDAIHSAQYALDIGKKIIQYFERYFEVPYPLNKIDMVAVPDFAAGAMENWGLMIYREPTMLWDAQTSTALSRQRVAAVISHEIAHQWFGNLVTLTWWDDLWLNEGFASFAEYIGIQHVHPEWLAEDYTLLETVPKAMFADANPNSRPIVQRVNSPFEINGIFDLIVYNKGAAVVRMVQAFLGRETFRLGIKKYLTNHKFKNILEDDLWESLSDSARERGLHLNIKAIMDTWLRQKNFPLVTVKDLGNGNFRFTQSRYIESINMKRIRNESKDNFLWHIPISYASPIARNWNESEVIWFKEKTMNTKLMAIPGQWYVINIRQTGFYRVHYDDSNWDRLIEQLQKDPTVFPSTQRIQIIEDLFHVTEQGLVPITKLLDLSKYLPKEENYGPLESSSRVLTFLLRMLSLDSNYGKLKAHVRHILDRHLKAVDWQTMVETENHEQHLRRMTVVQMACHAEHKICVKEAKTMFENWMKNKTYNNIPPAIRLAVYCTALQHGGQLEWQFLYNQLLGKLRIEEVTNIRSALPCTREAWLLKRYLNDFVLSDNTDAGDIIDAVQPFTHTPLGQTILWDYIRESWHHLATGTEDDTKRGPNSSSLVLLRIYSRRNIQAPAVPLPKDIHTIGRVLSNDTIRNLYRRHFRDVYRRAEYNMQWLKKHREEINDWLQQNVPNESALM